LKWRGSKELNHLLWLLVHHPAEVAEVVAGTRPAVVTRYDPARRALSHLMSGQKLTEVLDSVKDSDMTSVLLSVAAKERLYSADNAKNAAIQIVDKLEIQHIDEQIVDLEQEMATCTSANDTSSYFSLIEKRQALQERKNAIRSRFARSS